MNGVYAAGLDYIFYQGGNTSGTQGSDRWGKAPVVHRPIIFLKIIREYFFVQFRVKKKPRNLWLAPR